MSILFTEISFPGVSALSEVDSMALDLRCVMRGCVSMALHVVIRKVVRLVASQVNSSF